MQNYSKSGKIQNYLRISLVLSSKNYIFATDTHCDSKICRHNQRIYYLPTNNRTDMKTIKSYALLAIILMMCSCEKFTSESGKTSEEKENTNVALNLTKGELVKTVCQKAIFSFFKDDQKIGTVSQTTDDTDFGAIHLSLSPGTYRIVAIGHNGSGNCTITSPEKITFTNNKLTDTFYHYGTIEVKKDENTSESITLKRAVAMFRLNIKDEIPANAKSIQFYYTGGSSTFNAVSGYGCVNSKQTETLDITSGQQVYEVYTFPHEDGKKLQMTISILNESGITIASRTFSDVIVKKNYITKYSGKLFVDNPDGETTDIDIEFEFDPEWAGEDEYEF